jgi:uncharacterized protein YecE (DUF72 family)
MKFGTLPDDQLSSVSFQLPPDPAFNITVLSGARVAQPRLYVGSGNWGHTSWVGKVYPPKTPVSAYRTLFPRHFGAMELNATHYKIYPESVLKEWAQPAAELDFRYCPKFPQSISHYSSFVQTDALTDAFLQSIQGLGEHLGPAFLQVSDHFSPVRKDVLFQYLASLPVDMDVFLELRHPDWFRQMDTWVSELRDLKKGLVITDAPARRDAVPMYLTVPRLFLRFVCNRDHPTTFTRIQDWASRIAHWVDNGLEEAYIFLHPGDESVIPELTIAWIQALNASCGVKLRLPFIPQTSLF